MASFIPIWVMGFDRLKSNNLSGASEIYQRTLTYWADEISHIDPPSLRRAHNYLRRRGHFIICLQPRMAPLFNLVNRVLLAAAEAINVQQLKDKTIAVLEDSGHQLSKAQQLVCDECAKIVPPSLTVGLHSRSSMVVHVISSLVERGVDMRVIQTESRPMNEGLTAARFFCEHHIQVTFLVDAALATMIQKSDMIFVGADTFSTTQITNKIGTHALALLAREHQTPIYCLTTGDKYLPQGIHIADEEQHESHEVWPDRPEGVTVWNKYFEDTPAELFTGIITEHGVLQPSELDFFEELYELDPWLRERFESELEQE